MQIVTVIWFALCLLVGGLAAWLAASRALQPVREQLAARNVQIAERDAELERLREVIREAQQFAQEKEEDLKQEQRVSRGAGELVASLQAKLQASEEKLALLNDAEKRLGDAFAVLSRRALSENSGEFLKLAKGSFEIEQKEARGELKGNHDAFLQLIKPVEETIVELGQRVQRLSEDKDRLANEARGLSNALRRAEIRGRWGELHLQRVAELAGMRDRCDFSLQQTFKNEEDRRRRPDMVVNLPLERYVVVDAKAVMDAYICACECTEPTLAAEHMARHARLVRDKVDELAKIDYATVLEKKGKNVADMVICFLPGEAFFSAAVSQDPTLLEYAARNRVFLASPTILITLLRAIGLGWRDHERSENAEQVAQLGKELYSRLGVMKSHFDNLGDSVRNTVDHYNRMVSSLNSRVFPQARKFRELRTAEAGAKDIGDSPFVDAGVQHADGADWVQPMLIAASADEED